MVWKWIKSLFKRSEADREMIEAIKNPPSCTRVSKGGGLFKGPGCTKNNCKCDNTKNVRGK